MKCLIFALIIIYGWNTIHDDQSLKARDEIMNADRSMNKKASVEGFNKSLLAYADDSVIKPSEGEFPVIGKIELANKWKGKDGTKQISWEPVTAVASESGDLGYTFGNWKFVTTDSVYYGNYCTVWKKQSDGSWKFIYDGGNNTPPPVK